MLIVGPQDPIIVKSHNLSIAVCGFLCCLVDAPVAPKSLLVSDIVLIVGPQDPIIVIKSQFQ